MVDLNKYIADALKEFAPVELAGSESKEKIPAIVIEQVSNKANTVINGEDRTSDIYYQIDVYACTARETNELAVKVGNAMTKLGFVRTNGATMGIQRYMMTFSVRVDEPRKHFYHV